MNKPTPTLPVDEVLPDLIAALKASSAVVLRAPTGSGKTTRVPPGLLRSGLLGAGRLLLLQPRRVAARACARAMAAAMGEPLGETVGYRIRFESRESPRTRILVVTEGILSRRFGQDPLLEGVSCVVLDEFHERSIHTDLALAFLAELRHLREDLKLVVMSATFDTGPVAAFLGAREIETAGRAWPLSIAYRPSAPGRDQGAAVESALQHLLADPADDGGNVLIFLPGAPEIHRTMRYLARRDWPADLVPLHGSLSSAEQDAALAPGSRRRFILSTNIAETSLTIQGVTAVIDGGRRKAHSFDHRRGVDRLDTVRISKAGAGQRAGRAGRTAPGRVIRLWDEVAQATLADADPPEILTTDLAGPLLQIIDFHGPDLTDFPFFQRPEPERVQTALTLLRGLGAIDAGHRATPLGKRLLSLPLHPRIGALLERAAGLGFLNQAPAVCALINEPTPPGVSSDLYERFEELTRAERSPSAPTWRPVIAAATQLRARAGRLWPDAKSSRLPFDRRALAACLLAGYPDRVCQRRGPGQGVMVGGRGVVYDPAVLQDSDLFLAVDLIELGSDRGAAKAGSILPLAEALVEQYLVTERVDRVVFDPERGTVNGVRRFLYQDLVLTEKPWPNVPPELLAAELARRGAERFDEVFQPDRKTMDLLLRLRFAARHLAEENWPDVGEAGLAALLPRLCLGKRKFSELRALDWYGLLLSRLDWKQRELLDREVPEHWAVPSGSHVRLDYAPAFEASGHPVLAVRLQEMFGQRSTPRIARGRVPLLCHLLAPNMRPAQVTMDLESFWNTTYAEVRKELRRRYPKHAWPEDPWTATAVRGTGRRPKG